MLIRQLYFIICDLTPCVLMGPRGTVAADVRCGQTHGPALHRSPWRPSEGRWYLGSGTSSALSRPPQAGTVTRALESVARQAQALLTKRAVRVAVEGLPCWSSG